jgi:hypothetical protein
MLARYRTIPWIAALAAVLLLGAVPASAAGGPTTCGDAAHPCVGVHDPGSPGTQHPGGGSSGGGGGGGSAAPDKCPGGKYAGAVPFDPQPPKSDPIWGGHTDGAIYSGASWCIDGVEYLGPWVRWFATNPAATAPVVTPAQLAQDAFASLTMPAPRLYRSPSEANRDAGQPYTWVNIWTWFWTSPATWQPLSKTASLGGVWATVTVKPTSMTFNPGNGEGAVTCTGPGRAWTQGDGGAAPAAGGCGFRYRKASSSVTSTLTMHWAASWVGSGGAAGNLAANDTQATSTFKVEQMQVVSR